MKGLVSGIIGCACGVLLYSFFDFGWFGVCFFALLGALILSSWAWKKETAYLLVSIFMAGVVCGAVRLELVPRTLPEAFSPLVGTTVSIEGVVVADPDIRETSQRLTVEVVKKGASTRVLVVAPAYPKVRYGEKVTASGTLVTPQPFETDNGRTFRYDTFLAKDGVFALLKNANVEVVGEREGVFAHVRGALSDFKSAGIDALAVALSEPQASLAGGLILGGKQGLGESLLNDFIRSGLIHIVVLSGYNVMIVAQFILLMFGLVSKSKKWATVAAAATIGMFVIAAGAGAASIRAGIMAGISLYARASGRTYDAFRALLFAGVLMVLWNPLTLAFDPGFQLSFLATLGLIFGVPVVERWFVWLTSKFMREIVSATIAAQIAVLPLLLYQNGLFSLVAFPANILVLPVVPFAMFASLIALLAGLLVPFAAPALGLPAYILLSYITGVVETAARLPLAAFSVPAFPFVFVILAYALLSWWVYRVYTTASRKRFSHTDQLRFSKKAST